jgi:hypothetical protein
MARNPGRVKNLLFHCVYVTTLAVNASVCQASMSVRDRLVKKSVHFWVELGVVIGGLGDVGSEKFLQNADFSP